MSAAIIASAAIYRGFGYLGPREWWLSRPTYIARPLLKLKVGGPRAGFRIAGRQHAFDPAELFPCSLRQSRVCSHDVTQHVPGRDVQGAFGRGAHGQRDRAGRAEADALRCRLLARPHTDRLRKHVNRDRFMPGFEFPVAAKTEQVLQA